MKENIDMSKNEPCKDCGCDEWDEYYGPVCGIFKCKEALAVEKERDRYKAALKEIASLALGEDTVAFAIAREALR